MASDNEAGTIENPKNLHHILSPANIEDLVRGWIKEDIPSFDYAGIVVGDKIEEAAIIAKSPGILSGVPFVESVFSQLDCKVSWLCKEGEKVKPMSEVARVKGPAYKLLKGERIALNVLARSSGIATHARELSELAKDLKWAGEIAGTRKTTPGFRQVEKYSLLVGGVSTHRYDLSSLIMLKDNHIWVSGSVSEAIKRARSVGGFSLKIEVECRSLAEAEEAILSGAEIVMLDNFEPEALAMASRHLKGVYPFVTIEASGGIRRDTLAQYCLPSVDVISLSSTTQGYASVNYSLKILKEGRDPLNPKVTAENI